MKAKVVAIVEPFQNKTSKAGKPYSAMRVRVELENGESAIITAFNEVAEGATVEVEKKGEYWNVVNPKQAAENAKHDEVMTALRRIYAMQQAIYKAVAGEDVQFANFDPKASETARKSATDLARQSAQEYQDELPEGW